MTNEDIVIRQIREAFGIPGEDARTPRPRRIFITVPYNRFREILEYAVEKLGFSILCTITGLDETDSFALIYHVARQDGTMLSIRTTVPRSDPKAASVAAMFPAAEMYELEIAGLLGVNIEGLPQGKRYPLPDDWPADEYPLRKDWRPQGPRKEGKDHAQGDNPDRTAASGAQGA